MHGSVPREFVPLGCNNQSTKDGVKSKCGNFKFFLLNGPFAPAAMT
jgi:hypothetical protein